MIMPDVTDIKGAFKIGTRIPIHLPTMVLHIFSPRWLSTMLSLRNIALALARLGNSAINEISIDRRVSSRSDKVRGSTKKLIVRWSIYIPYQDATNLSNVFN